MLKELLLVVELFIFQKRKQRFFALSQSAEGAARQRLQTRPCVLDGIGKYMPLILLGPYLINAQTIQNKALLIKVAILLKPQVLTLVVFDNKIFVRKVLVVQSLPDHVLPEDGNKFFLHEIVPFVLLDA